MTRGVTGDLVADSPYERVPEGRYIVLIEKAERGRGWTDRGTGRPKETLYLRCVILAGPFAGTRLFMALNLTFRGRHPRPSSGFYSAWAVAMDRKPLRGERMSLRAFEGKVFETEVVTVTRDGLGRVRPKVTEYSRVSRLLQLLGTRDAYLPPRTEDGTPETEYPVPPSPSDSATDSRACENSVVVTSDGQAGRRVVGIQKQESEPGWVTEPRPGPTPDAPAEARSSMLGRMGEGQRLELLPGPGKGPRQGAPGILPGVGSKEKCTEPTVGPGGERPDSMGRERRTGARPALRTTGQQR